MHPSAVEGSPRIGAYIRASAVGLVPKAVEWNLQSRDAHRHKIKAWSREPFKPGHIRFVLQPVPGKAHPMEVPCNMTVEKLASQLEILTGTPAELQVLFFVGGEPFDSSCTLEECGVVAGCKVYLRRRNNLFHACFRQPTTNRHDILSGLLRMRPKFACETNTHGMLPLHLALDSSVRKSPNLVKDLIDCYPEALRVGGPPNSRGGIFPLHQALMYDFPGDVIEQMCQGMKSTDFDAEGNYCPDGIQRDLWPPPLMNLAVAHSSCHAVVGSLLAAKCRVSPRDPKNGYCAVECLLSQPHLTIDIFTEIFKKHFLAEEQDGIVQQTQFSSHMLHVALECRAPFEFVVMIVSAKPYLVRKSNAMGELPIHTAAAHRADRQLIKYLIERAPESIHAKTQSSLTPLQIAVVSRTERGVVTVFHEADPSTVQEYDVRGWNVLCRAVWADAPSWIIEELHHCGAVLHRKDDRGGPCTTPAHAFYMLLNLSKKPSSDHERRSVAELWPFHKTPEVKGMEVTKDFSVSSVGRSARRRGSKRGSSQGSKRNSSRERKDRDESDRDQRGTVSSVFGYITERVSNLSFGCV